MAPKVQEKRGVKGKVETREETASAPVVTTPVAVYQAGDSQSTGQLPVTGFNALIQIILGGFSLAGGGLLFRRSRAA